jgi:hypothetical protein
MVRGQCEVLELDVEAKEMEEVLRMVDVKIDIRYT